MSDQETASLIHQQTEQHQGPQLGPQDAPAWPNPLFIPELQQLIAMYMDKRDIASCLCVCREWYQAFLPSLWGTLELNLDRCSRTGPPLPERNKYWVLIRKLFVTCNGNFKMPCSTISCKNLSYLKLQDTPARGLTYRRSTLKNERSLAALIKRHHSSLRVFISNSNTTDYVMRALSGCTVLKKLELRFHHLDTLENWMMWYGPLWSRLESLSWRGVVRAEPMYRDIAIDLMNTFSITGLTTIQDLDLGHLGYEGESVELIHILLIVKSPKLLHLRWDAGFDSITALATIAQEITFGQHLKDLKLQTADMRTTDLKELFLRLPKLERFEAASGVMDLALLRTLQTETPQFLTIFKVLGLKGPSKNTGDLAQAILSSMTGLEEFSINYITDIDIRDGGGGWVCTGLKKLVAGIIVIDQGAQAMILDLLSSLKCLVTLDLSMSHLPYRNVPELPLGGSVSHYLLKVSLDDDLDKLKTLQRLERFTGPGNNDFPWTEKEARWVFEHWVRLKELRNISVSSQARDLLAAFMRSVY